MAGWGDYPVVVARALKRQSYEVYCQGIKGYTSEALADVCDGFQWTGLYKVGAAIRYFRRQGVRIIATSDGYDSESKARKVHRGFKGLMNEIFLDDLRDKTHRGLAGQALKQFWAGGRPYGYRLQPVVDPARLDQYGRPVRIGTKLALDAIQAPIVKEIFTISRFHLVLPCFETVRAALAQLDPPALAGEGAG